MTLPTNLDEKKGVYDAAIVSILPPSATATEVLEGSDAEDKSSEPEDRAIKTAADVAHRLLSLRDDGDPALTFRSAVIGTVMVGFCASMDQISGFKTNGVYIGGTLMIFICWLLGRAWAWALPRGDRLEAAWRAAGGGERPSWLRLALFINPGPFGLKEHALASITGSSASNGAAAVGVFTVQKLFYEEIGVSPTNVVLTTISVALFGYGLTGVLRPLTVWDQESVFWGNIGDVKLYQAMHWERIRDSKPYRWFWILAAVAFAYEWLPQYVFPWLVTVSIPCLAGMHATGHRASVITNIFGGSLANEGLGVLNWTFDWNSVGGLYFPLKYQANTIVGYALSIAAVTGVYYGNAWDAQTFPFMSTTLRRADGSKYNPAKVFENGVLNEAKLASYGTPRMAGTYVWNMFTDQVAVGGLVAHVLFFWGKGILRTIRQLRAGVSEDPHHAAMARYREAPWWWYASLMVISLVFGIVVTSVENTGLPVWGFIVAIVLGIVIAPFSTILYARFGSSVDTRTLSKMVASGVVPGRPMSLLYFSAWSHAVIAQSVNLASDLKLGEYLKIPPRTMFISQVWGTLIGAFVNYAVMTGIVGPHKAILTEGNGNYIWTGVGWQSSNTMAASWSLAKYMYSAGGPYFLVPLGLVIGFFVVLLHRVFTRFVPRIGGLETRDINFPILIFSTGTLASGTNSGALTSYALAFYVQWYVRNRKPAWYKRYAYVLPVGLDLGTVLVGFIAAFALFGVGGRTVAFPSWWGNPADGYPDHCPSTAS